MRPTRLHIVLALAAVLIFGYAGYIWYQGNTSSTLAPVLPSQKPVASAQKPAAAPVPAASAARPATPASGDTYAVARGDTLWTIAQNHSPVRDGAGWVAIWKANSRLVKDFNRIEIGWTLTIPQKADDYVMPYWRPRALAFGTRPPANQLVELRELPIAPESQLVDLRELPVTNGEALAQAPRTLEVDVAELPRPGEPGEVDLAELPAPSTETGSSAPRPVLVQLPLSRDARNNFVTADLKWPAGFTLAQPQYH